MQDSGAGVHVDAGVGREPPRAPRGHQGHGILRRQDPSVRGFSNHGRAPDDGPSGSAPVRHQRRRRDHGARAQKGVLQKVFVRALSGGVVPRGPAPGPFQRRGGRGYHSFQAGRGGLPDVDLSLPQVGQEPVLLRPGVGGARRFERVFIAAGGERVDAAGGRAVPHDRRGRQPGTRDARSHRELLLPAAPVRRALRVQLGTGQLLGAAPGRPLRRRRVRRAPRASQRGQGERRAGAADRGRGWVQGGRAARGRPAHQGQLTVPGALSPNAVADERLRDGRQGRPGSGGADPSGHHRRLRRVRVARDVHARHESDADGHARTVHIRPQRDVRARRRRAKSRGAVEVGVRRPAAARGRVPRQGGCRAEGSFKRGVKEQAGGRGCETLPAHAAHRRRREADQKRDRG